MRRAERAPAQRLPVRRLLVGEFRPFRIVAEHVPLKDPEMIDRYRTEFRNGCAHFAPCPMLKAWVCLAGVNRG